MEKKCFGVWWYYKKIWAERGEKTSHTESIGSHTKTKFQAFFFAPLAPNHCKRKELKNKSEKRATRDPLTLEHAHTHTKRHTHIHYICVRLSASHRTHRFTSCYVWKKEYVTCKHTHIYLDTHTHTVMYLRKNKFGKRKKRRKRQQVLCVPLCEVQYSPTDSAP